MSFSKYSIVLITLWSVFTAKPTLAAEPSSKRITLENLAKIDISTMPKHRQYLTTTCVELIQQGVEYFDPEMYGQRTADYCNYEVPGLFSPRSPQSIAGTDLSWMSPSEYRLTQTCLELNQGGVEYFEPDLYGRRVAHHCNHFVPSLLNSNATH